MTTATRIRVVTVALVGLAIWPLIHHGLVRRCGIEPCKFAGWAMYARPANKRLVDIVAVDGIGIPLTPRRFSPEVRAAAATFRRRRAVYGRLVSPRPLAWVVFDHHPHVAEVTIRIRDLSLSPHTDRFESTVESYRFERADRLP